MTRQCVRKHEEDVSKSIKHQPKKFWNYVNKKIKTTETIPALKIGPDKWAMNDKDKADTLANFFSSVFTIETPGSWEKVDYQENQIPDDLFISKETILNELNALDTTKSMGSDNVHPRVLRESRYEIAEMMSGLMQSAWEKGEIPEDWKCANISTIHKKDAKSDPNNYRPISLASICCKIMEKIIRRHLFEFLENNHIIEGKQVGFLPGRSTTLQLLRALDDWTAELAEVTR